MRLSSTTIEVCPQDGHVEDARAAVSLHSHSNESRETLDFVPQLAGSIPIVATLFARSTAAYERENGRPLEFNDYFWRPPLTPAAVIASEQHNIEHRLGVPALVSLTDHDTLAGPKYLRAAGRNEVPLSVEWSVPFENAIIHLGVHALPADRVEAAEHAFAAYTSRREGDLSEILHWLVECPDTFIVLNHPYWDMARVGALRHESTLLTFLQRHGDCIHGLELNGYRSWTENRRVLPLAEGFGIPVVGGGDRHGRSPNAIINVTKASCLGEFARELRAGKPTHCVIFPEYIHPFAARLLAGAGECLAPDAMEDGSTRGWSDRVFGTVNGVDLPLSGMWEAAPTWLRGVIGLTRVLASSHVQRLYRLASPSPRRQLEADLWSDANLEARPPRQITLTPAVE